MNRRIFVARLMPAGLLLVGSGWSLGQDAAPAGSAVSPVVANYASIVQATYEDTVAGALGLQASVRKLVAQPSQAALDDARKAWLAAREWYGQTEVFRFYGGPIVRPGASLHRLPRRKRSRRLSIGRSSATTTHQAAAACAA